MYQSEKRTNQKAYELYSIELSSIDGDRCGVRGQRMFGNNKANGKTVAERESEREWKTIQTETDW